MATASLSATVARTATRTSSARASTAPERMAAASSASFRTPRAARHAWCAAARPGRARALGPPWRPRWRPPGRGSGPSPRWRASRDSRNSHTTSSSPAAEGMSSGPVPRRPWAQHRHAPHPRRGVGRRLGANGTAGHGRSSSRSHSTSRTRRPMAASSTDLTVPLVWVRACTMQMIPHRMVPNTCHQCGWRRRRLSAGTLVGRHQLLDGAEPADGRRRSEAPPSHTGRPRSSRGSPR